VYEIIIHYVCEPGMLNWKMAGHGMNYPAVAYVIKN
jgi:hypothetical protein